jgi:hypothetical protein
VGLCFAAVVLAEGIEIGSELDLKCGTAGAKARGFFAWFKYGLKPVPFMLKPVSFKLKPIPLRLELASFKLKPVSFNSFMGSEADSGDDKAGSGAALTKGAVDPLSLSAVDSVSLKADDSLLLKSAVDIEGAG